MQLNLNLYFYDSQQKNVTKWKGFEKKYDLFRQFIRIFRQFIRIFRDFSRQNPDLILKSGDSQNRVRLRKK